MVVFVAFSLWLVCQKEITVCWKLFVLGGIAASCLFVP